MRDFESYSCNAYLFIEDWAISGPTVNNVHKLIIKIEN